MGDAGGSWQFRSSSRFRTLFLFRVDCLAVRWLFPHNRAASGAKDLEWLLTHLSAWPLYPGQQSLSIAIIVCIVLARFWLRMAPWFRRCVSQLSRVSSGEGVGSLCHGRELFLSHAIFVSC